MMITLYKAEIHREQIKDYLLTHIEDSLVIGYRGLFEEEDGGFWDMKAVYMKEDKVCGFLFTSSDSMDSTLFINNLIVFEGHRKEGIAKELYEYVTAYAKRISLTNVFITCFGRNKGALEMYTKLGFIEHGRCKYGNRKYGEWDENIYLYKDISND